MRYDIRHIVYQIPDFLSRPRWWVSFAVQEGAEVRKNSRDRKPGERPGRDEESLQTHSPDFNRPSCARGWRCHRPIDNLR